MVDWSDESRIVGYGVARTVAGGASQGCDGTGAVRGGGGTASGVYHIPPPKISEVAQKEITDRKLRKIKAYAKVLLSQKSENLSKISQISDQNSKIQTQLAAIDDNPLDVYEKLWGDKKWDVEGGIPNLFPFGASPMIRDPDTNETFE